MIDVVVDGRKVEVAEGSVVMHAADAAGVYVPHFCYHRKLSIAANCRMCLVDIEKMPKPMPACATPVAAGMVVRTASDKARAAQRSVMEFLLINHPLDCPICDQGGECQLQDLAVGYGASASRYTEEKRVVFHKDVGPLVAMEEMTRCIHCTRCVRFGVEVAGVMELGMVHRGEHSEITTVAGRTVDSELSGNMIDLCPVGALTSKPFRYQARTWELSRFRSVSPHDSTGANIVVQVKQGRVLRVLPYENDAVNECWISDRDRFAYPALHGSQRLAQPMVKHDGAWRAVDWSTALDYVADGLKRVRAEFADREAGAGIGAVAHPMATVEELHLLQRLVRGLGSESVDFRTRQTDADIAAPAGRARWLGMPLAELSTLDAALVVGSFLRKDHPLFALRLRHTVRHGARVHALHATADDWAMPLAGRVVVPPSRWVAALAGVAAAVAQARGVAAPVAAAPPNDAMRAAAQALGDGQRAAVLLGNAAMQHPQASRLLALAQWIATHTGARCGVTTDGANAVGAQLVGAVPGPGGLTAAQMLAQPMKALVLLHTEPLLDAADAAAARRALAGSGLVVALTSFADGDAAEFADVLLPVAPFSETAGTFVSAEGRVQGFRGVAQPVGQTRPAWKVLRVLGNLLGLSGFDFDTADAVRDAALGDVAQLADRFDNAVGVDVADIAIDGDGDAAGNGASRDVASRAAAPRDASSVTLERIADVPIHTADPIARRSPPLQATADARPPAVGLPTASWHALGAPARVLVHQGDAAVVLPAREDPQLAAGVARIAAGHADTAALGPMFGTLTVERV